MISVSSRKTSSKNILHNRISVSGVLVSVILLLGLFGPWLTTSSDAYAILNPETKTGQRKYHTRVELSPLYGSMYKDDVFVERYWFISPGTSFAGLLLAISASLSIFKYKSSWAHFILFMVASLGIIVFFLSVGRGISIGVYTKVGWGLRLTSIGLLVFFVVSFTEMIGNNISRFID